MNFLNIPFEIPRSVASATTKTLFVLGASSWGNTFLESFLPNPATFGLWLQYFLLGCAGGFVRELLGEETTTWKKFVSNIFVAGFLGGVMSWICSLVNMTSTFTNIIVALSGLQGPFVLSVLKKWFKSLLKSVLREAEGAK